MRSWIPSRLLGHTGRLINPAPTGAFSHAPQETLLEARN